MRTMELAATSVSSSAAGDDGRGCGCRLLPLTRMASRRLGGCHRWKRGVKCHRSAACHSVFQVRPDRNAAPARRATTVATQAAQPCEHTLDPQRGAQRPDVCAPPGRVLRPTGGRNCLCQRHELGLAPRPPAAAAGEPRRPATPGALCRVCVRAHATNAWHRARLHLACAAGAVAVSPTLVHLGGGRRQSLGVPLGKLCRRKLLASRRHEHRCPRI